MVLCYGLDEPLAGRWRGISGTSSGDVAYCREPKAGAAGRSRRFAVSLLHMLQRHIHQFSSISGFLDWTSVEWVNYNEMITSTCVWCVLKVLVLERKESEIILGSLWKKFIILLMKHQNPSTSSVILLIRSVFLVIQNIALKLNPWLQLPCQEYPNQSQ